MDCRATLVARSGLLARVPLRRGGQEPDSDVAVGFVVSGVGNHDEQRGGCTSVALLPYLADNGRAWLRLGGAVGDFERVLTPTEPVISSRDTLRFCRSGALATLLRVDVLRERVI